MVATKSPKIDAPTVTTVPLEDWGVFGPPLGEPLDGPMPTGGSGSGPAETARFAPACGNVARAAFARPTTTRANLSGSWPAR
jgi:hypothetical protein